MSTLSGTGGSITLTVLSTLTTVVSTIATPTPTLSLSTNATTDSSTSSPTSASTSDTTGEASNTSKIIGLSLAIGSGLLIGSSFVFKKKGLINCTKNGMLAGEGHAYLKSFMWWTGMLMMVAGEVCNFVAYAFVQPILVTPLGALSVVICAILSSIFLRERLNLQGKVGCAQCIVGATIIVLHAPEQTAVKTIQEFEHLMKQPAFLSWMIVIIISSLVLIFKVGPKWGKEHMMVYIGICSLIGSLSVVATQGLGAAIVHNISTGEPQFNQWFTYFVIVFMVITLLTEINYLNKALNLFNTAMVTPTYYVTFTSATIITSAIFYQGFAASAIAILTICLGFFVICGGVLLLQTSKPAVPVQIPGSSSSAIGTITYEEMEPTAADMRASPFSSIRRISRDLRQPSIIGSGTSAVFQSSPLNPRAESLLQRKRRASNAAQWSRPQSMISQHLAVPGTNTNSIAGTTTAFFPPTAGAYSTMVMGPNGAQIRLQLCEIVVSDEKNETSRYQVYRPIPPYGDLSHPTTGDISEKGVGVSTGFKHPFPAQRGSLAVDSLSSSIRFDAFAHDDEKNEQSPPQKSPAQRPFAQLSGSMFSPPKLAVSPPNPSPQSNGSASDPASNPTPASPKAPSGPLAPGGSFFARPRFRSPSTSTAASGDIMEMNDPAHAGRTFVSIEPVQRQPVYSIYVPPTPHISPKSVPSASLPVPIPSFMPVSTTVRNTNSNASLTANVTGGDRSHEKELSQPTSDGDTNDSNDTLEEWGIKSPPAKPRRSLFGLGKFFGSKDNEHKQDALTSNSLGTTLSSESSSSTTPLNPGMVRQFNPMSPVVFNRTNHPTRISEGEEEEDTEDIKS
ncbi:hypothetical protein BGX21_000541 [Mortierella sp. AD011]|nr:hypothetical protein BGX20_001225 [Mortierella sp. AD010]KAF9387472.1 hypothetical protein BGX21_000541 [Mortierella sp. AD011]